MPKRPNVRSIKIPMRTPLSSSLAFALAACLAVGLGLAYMPPAIAGIAGMDGAGASAIVVTNLDAEAGALAVLDFYPQSGGAPTTVQAAPIGPHSSAVTHLTDVDALSRGAYAAAVSSDRSFGILTRTDWPTVGGAVLHGGPEPANELLLPWIETNSQRGHTSYITIQNTDTSQHTRVTFTLVDDDGAVVTDNQLAIGPGASLTLSLAHDPQFMVIPDGFSGSGRITADAPVAAVVFQDDFGALGVWSYEGIPSDAASSELWAPMVFHDWGGSHALSTTLAILNPGDEPADVQLTYVGFGGECDGQSLMHDVLTVAGGGLTVVPVADALPEGCAAAAHIKSTVPVAAVGSAFDADNGAAAGYGLRAPDAGAETVILPLIRRHSGFLPVSSERRVSCFPGGHGFAALRALRPPKYDLVRAESQPVLSGW